MKRREMLLTTGTALLGLSAFPLRWAAAADDKKKQKVLYYTRSAGFVHSVVNRNGKPLAYSEEILTKLGSKVGLEVVCSQDPAIFDGDLGQFDAFIFYTTGNCIGDSGKQNLLEAVHGGKGFVGLHCASDTFHANGIDPYIAMLGGEFNGHQSQQKATMRVADPKFPGLKGLSPSFSMLEEWYTFKKLATDMHVILVQETAGMHDAVYQRPPYPATWARKHGKGRVFYSSMGHREDVWTSKPFTQILLGGIAWALGNVKADVRPNFQQVTPNGNQLKN